jgi:hypothetical protein
MTFGAWGPNNPPGAGGDLNPGTLTEIAEPSAPGADQAFIYARDNNGVTVLEFKTPDGDVMTLGPNYIAKNLSGATLVKGEVVFISGGVGASGVPEVKKARADSLTTMPGVGISKSASVAANGFARILRGGLLRSIDTTGGAESWSQGDRLYVSAVTAGKLTNVVPTAPNFSQRVAVVINVHATQGSIFVDLDAINNPDHGQLVGLLDDDHTQYIRHAEAPLGQCYLSKSGDDLLLSRYNGSALFINGDHHAIPSGGVTLTTSGLSINTTYYIYAFMNGSTMTLEASVTARAADSTYGHQIKSGDATRTLVGLARTIAGPAWQDTAAQRFVISWFNRRNITSFNFYTADVTLTTPTSFTEFSTSVRNEFLIWSEDIALSWGAAGGVSSSTANWTMAIAYDGTTAEDFTVFPNGSSNTRHGVSFMTAKTGLAEGYHLTAMVGKVGSGNLTLDILANAAGERPGFMTLVRG